MVQPDPNM